VQAQFDPPLAIPQNIQLVAEIDAPDRDPAPPLNADSGALWIGTNSLGTTGPSSYLRSVSCGVANYIAITDLPGFESAQLVQEVHLNEVSSCIWDCQPVPNMFVDVPDFLAILAQWGQSGTSCDFGTGDPGVGINEFLDFLANFGPCP
jgi:hypothetical protein